MKQNQKERFIESVEFLFPWQVIKRRRFTHKDVQNIKDDVGDRMNTVYFVVAFLCLLLGFSLNLYMELYTGWSAPQVYGLFAAIGRYVLMAGSSISIILFMIAKQAKNLKLVKYVNRIAIILFYLSTAFYMFTGFYSDAEKGFTSTETETISASVIFIAILVMCQPAHWLDAFLLDVSTSITLVVLSIICNEQFGLSSLHYYGLIALVYPIVCYLIITILFFAESQHYIENKRIERLTNTANYDSLTKCKSRYALDEYLTVNIPRWERKGNANVFMILFDIDNFKQYNDQFTHLGGDYCLKTICEAIRQAFPSPDLDFFRYGGEEFLLFFELKSKDEAYELIEKARSSVEELKIIAPKGAPKEYVTISLGGVYIKNVEKFSFEETMLKADTCLYLAKEKGKNIAVINGEIVPKK